MSIWDHNWLGDGSFISKPTDLYHELEDLTVADLMIENTRLWDVGFIWSLVNAEDAAKILKTPNLESIHHYKLSWNHEKNGVYTVRNGYRLSLHHQNSKFSQSWESAANLENADSSQSKTLHVRVNLKSGI